MGQSQLYFTFLRRLLIDYLLTVRKSSPESVTLPQDCPFPMSLAAHCSHSLTPFLHTFKHWPRHPKRTNCISRLLSPIHNSIKQEVE